MTRADRSPRGVTAVELLVAAALCAVVFGIAFQMFRTQARESAYRIWSTEANGRMRQNLALLGKALEQAGPVTSLAGDRVARLPLPSHHFYRKDFSYRAPADSWRELHLGSAEVRLRLNGDDVAADTTPPAGTILSWTSFAHFEPGRATAVATHFYLYWSEVLPGPDGAGAVREGRTDGSFTLFRDLDAITLSGSAEGTAQLEATQILLGMTIQPQPDTGAFQMRKPQGIDHRLQVRVPVRLSPR